MLIDCAKCEVRNVGCDDCVVSVMLADLAGGLEIGELELRALGILADGDMIPPLRMTISGQRAS